MQEADQNETNLTDEERNRNRSGQILVFFNRTRNTPALKCVQLEEKARYVATFTAKDSIAGRLTEPKTNVMQFVFEHPKFEHHLIQILPGAILPEREVEDHEIDKIDREVYNGREAIEEVQQMLMNYGYQMQ